MEFVRPTLKKQKTRTKKMTIETLVNSNPFFDEKNPITYKVFLQRRPDLSQEEKDYYNNLIKDLEEEQRDERDENNERLRPASVILQEMNKPVEIKVIE